MKKKLIIFFTLPLFFIFIACEKNEKAIEQEHYDAALKKVELADTVKWIVILPELGCKGCIQEAEIFMKEQVENPAIFFVLTRVESLKVLQKKIGITVKNHHNVFVDKEYAFDIPTNNSIYPCIIKVENGKIVAHEFQSPTNSAAFQKLKMRITGNL